MKKLNLLIKKIQRSNEKTKRNIYIISATISMTIIIGIWVLYINIYPSNQKKIVTNEIPQKNETSQINDNNPNIRNAFKEGIEIIQKKITDSLQNGKKIISNLFGKTNDIVIQNSQ